MHLCACLWKPEHTVDVCVCVHRCTCVGVYIHLCASLWRPEHTLGVVSVISSESVIVLPTRQLG